MQNAWFFKLEKHIEKKFKLQVSSKGLYYLNHSPQGPPNYKVINKRKVTKGYLKIMVTILVFKTNLH